MKKISYGFLVVGLLFLGFLVGIRDFSGPFLKNALIIITLLVVGVTFLAFAYSLAHYAKKREEEELRLLMNGQIPTREHRRIPALKKR